MDFRTIVKIPSYKFSVSHTDKFLILGSCFAENIGLKLAVNKFNVHINPFGILYNPMSIKSALEELLREKRYTKKDLFASGELYHSFSHHGKFSSPDPDVCLNTINSKLPEARSYLINADFLIITFGTAYIYRLKETGKVVSNCHKLPEKLFERSRIEVVEIVHEYTSLIKQLIDINPNLTIMFTVSPIRHLKDGAHENQLSKSTLLLAIDHLHRQFDNVCYFPSYEIVMDELRDYRFYAEDMTHISDTAIAYLWERFTESCLSEKAKEFILKWNKITKAIDHRPFNPHSEQYHEFLMKNTEFLLSLKKEYPEIDIEKELTILQNKAK